MPLNVPGLLVPFQLLIHPRLVIPSLLVKDIRQIDFPALKRAGYRGAIFDKDNCLARPYHLYGARTFPHRDTLVPELQEAWKQCRETFGEGNILIVSNSAGTFTDAGGIQAKSVSHHLQVPVLLHASLKPSYSCIKSIHTYFSSLRTPINDNELIIVGDRIFTDIVLANRIRMQCNRHKSFLGLTLSSAYVKDGTLTTEKETIDESQGKQMGPRPLGPLSVWTTGVWKRESMLMRWLEFRLVKAVERWSNPPQGKPMDMSRFVKEIEKPSQSSKSSILEELVARWRRS
ncbi:mitochondrial PGP phosphatase-domain-containing protein [Crassisporium funariophilum]|nr:mitochondrial PGP phosphatase-domain-containing protein [Crassisporium funariophilum]